MAENKYQLILKNWRRWPDWVRAYVARKIQPPLRYTDINYETTLRTWMRYQHDNDALRHISWMGVHTLKNPLDLWIYQELIWTVRPDVIVEIGSYRGGSALFLAHLMDIMGHGEVISLDIARDQWEVSHQRIVVVTGDSRAPQTIAKVTQLVEGKRTLLIHDGDHKAITVLQDLRAYAPLVSVDSYCIVEDGTVDALKTETTIRPLLGPLYAIEQFLAEAPHFQIDHSCERYIITKNPSGYLKRIA